MGLFSLLIQIMSSLAIYSNLVSSLVEVNWFASTPTQVCQSEVIEDNAHWECTVRTPINNKQRPFGKTGHCARPYPTMQGNALIIPY